MYKKSIKAFQESKKVIPGGVNSPVRAFKSVGCDPVFLKEEKAVSYMILMEINILIVFPHGGL